MILAIKNKELAQYGSIEIVEMNDATPIYEDNVAYAVLNATVVEWYQTLADEVPDGSSLYREGIVGKLPDGSGGWVDQEITDSKVSARHFTKDLLGLPVYGGLLTALDGLKAKFAAGTATESNIQTQTLLNVAKELMAQPEPIDLQDPVVSQMLDVAVAIPYIVFDAEDKERVLSNTLPE